MKAAVVENPWQHAVLPAGKTTLLFPCAGCLKFTAQRQSNGKQLWLKCQNVECGWKGANASLQTPEGALLANAVNKLQCAQLGISLEKSKAVIYQVETTRHVEVPKVAMHFDWQASGQRLRTVEEEAMPAGRPVGAPDSRTGSFLVTAPMLTPAKRAWRRMVRWFVFLTPEATRHLRVRLAAIC